MMTTACIIISILVIIQFYGVTGFVTRRSAIKKNQLNVKHEDSHYDAAASSGGNINFEKWLYDAPIEVTNPQRLNIQGNIPSYVQGSLIRNGGAQWTVNGNNNDDTANQRYAHAFDGFAKLTRYEIKGSGDGDEQQQQEVLFSTKFIESKWRNAALNRGILLEGLTTGPRMNHNLTQILDFNLISSLWNSISFDNAPVNIWDFGQQGIRKEGTNGNNNHHPNVYAITDAPTRAHIDPATLDTKRSARPPSLAKNFGGYEFLTTAHPEYCKRGSGDTYNLIVEFNPILGNRVSIVKEYPKEGGSIDRRIVASCKVPVNAGEVPYFHSFGLTETKAMVILQPLRIGFDNIPETISKGFLSTMKDEARTRVIVFDLESGETLSNVELDEPVYFYHSISCTETVNKDSSSMISMKICGYKVPDLIASKDQFFRFDRCQTAKGRNRIHRGGKICDVKVNLSDGKAQVKWTDVTVKGKDQKTVKQGFELPTTRYSRYTSNSDNGAPCAPWKNGQHPKFAYAFGSYALGSDSYDTWTLLKINLDNGKATSLRERDSCYYSEPIFVADPKGKEEDDGVLLCQRYDGVSDQTSLLVIDAKDMSVLAEANTEIRNAMDFHGVFIPRNK